MRKDFLVALLLGFGVGLTIAVSVLYAPKILSFRPSLSFLSDLNKKEEIKAPTPIPTQSVGNILTIESPKDGTITKGTSVKLKGKTDPNAKVIITTNQEDTIIDSNGNGSFETEIDILEGSNILYISSYKNGELSGQKAVEVYQTEETI